MQSVAGHSDHKLVSGTMWLYLVNVYDVGAMQAGVGRLLAIAIGIGVVLLVLEAYFPDKPRDRR